MPIPFAKGSLVTAAVAAAAFWLARGDQEAEPTAVPSATDAGPATDDATGTPAVERRPVAAETAAAEKLRELQASSETFRNTTFLIAIRDAGYVCTELRDVYGGINHSHTWTATCADMLAYTVSVTADGRLAVDPMLHHLDSTPPRPPVDGGRNGPPRSIVPLEPR
jgi:hypothetical protein